MSGPLNEPVWEEPKVKERVGQYDHVLRPLMDHPGSWAKIGEYKNDSAAYQAARNLSKRDYRIPEPDANWVFRSSENAVFACFDPSE
jgi:hypothetical protein